MVQNYEFSSFVNDSTRKEAKINHVQAMKLVRSYEKVQNQMKKFYTKQIQVVLEHIQAQLVQFTKDP